MKRLHIILLIITVTMALFSAYSLAAINQVYKINFEWYSQYKQSFSDNPRVAIDEKWSLDKYPDKMTSEIFTDKNGILGSKDKSVNKNLNIDSFNFQKDILLYFTLGEVNSPEYRIKVVDIAQRGNVVEIKVSLNSPAKSDILKDLDFHTYFPSDIIKISKDAFPIKGKLYFIFKNQAGNKIGEKSCTI